MRLEQYKDEIIFYVYRKQDDSTDDKLIGRIGYNTRQLPPLKREYWTQTKLTALSLGERFTARMNF